MDKGFSPDEYEAIGKSYYRKKQYEKALEAFTSGIDASVIPTVALFDYRAAAFEKLANFHAAVKDGREAIRLNKRDVRGYLRTGNALQKLNKLDTAVSIYKYGMKNVPVHNKDFQLLQQLHDKLTRKLAPAKAIDPFTVLPVELVEMILSYLPFRNMVNCLRVSKSWKQYLTTRPKLWQNLNLAGATKPVSRVFIRHAVRYSENGVTSLTIHRFQHTDVLRNIATICKQLHTIEIRSLPIMFSGTLIEIAQCAANLKKLVLHTDITTDTAVQFIHHRPTLEHLELHSLQPPKVWRGEGHTPFYPENDTFSCLHTVLLRSHTKACVLSERFLRWLLTLSPNLQSFTLEDWSSWFSSLAVSTLYKPPLRSLVLKNIDMVHFPSLPNTTNSLVFHPQRPVSLIPHSSITPTINPEAEPVYCNALCSNTAQLEHLSIKGVHNLRPYFFDCLLDIYKDESGNINDIEDAKDLVSLSLDGQLETPMRIFGTSGLCASPRMITSALTTLKIAIPSCNDDDVETLVVLAQNIEDIDVSATRITGASIKMLADGLPRLRVLKADDCPGVSSRDAVAYAERKEIAVSCRMGSLTGGRKVRYG